MYDLSIKDVEKKLGVDKKVGLTEGDAEARLLSDGKNAIREGKQVHPILKFLKQFTNVLIIILMIASGLQIAIAIIENEVKEYISAGLIWTVILVNAFIGYIQESKAEKAVEALKNQTKPYAKALRGGEVVKVKAEELVVGDIVLLEAGDIVPADLRLFECASLQIEEAALTGESVPSQKNTEQIEVKGVALGDRTNMAFMGGVVTYGRGRGIVVAAGMNTEMGLIATDLNRLKAPKTPLAKRLDKTSHMIAILVGLVSIGIFASRLLTGETVIDAMMITIAIAVCSVPEGLPAAVSITMALATQRMSKKKAIMRNLPAVETLGSTEIICSDKTGTITLNKMTVQNIFMYSGAKPKVFEIKGQMLNVRHCLENDCQTDIKDIDEFRNRKCFKMLMETMLLCNDSQTRYEHGVLSTIGDPTETALVHAANRFGFSKEYADAKYLRVCEIPFDSERKLMSTVNRMENELILFTKGAPVSIMERCTKILDNGKVRPITEKDRKEIDDAGTKFAKDALRVLGYAYKPLGSKKEFKACLSDESDLIFVGLTGMIDPPREEVYESIKTCKAAHIKVVMITGDHKDTAFAIAKQIGIAEEEDEVITGAQLNEISDDELRANVFKYSVYARVNPEHKVRIVEAFKANDKVVAMTGDGVNDAASIKAADIGVGMGITGTDVTKKVADMILTDDNFATIVGAVKEGRRTLTNIKKIVIYLFGISLAELILLTTIIVIFGMNFFGPILILWINVITGTLPALALGSLPAEKDIMNQRPTSARQSLFRGQTGRLLVIYSLFQVVLCGSVYFLAYFGLNLSSIESVTVAYLTLVIIEAIQTFNLCSTKTTVFSKRTFSSKWVNGAVLGSLVIGFIPIIVPIAVFQAALGVTAISGAMWLVAFAFALLIIPMVEAYKYYMRRQDRAKKEAELEQSAVQQTMAV
ncbi:MAG: cation-translocating P-type ATPase [Firmicutes bacterium]|nr:cation-translocating P-type ATPase [Bacillota bacterium]